MASQAEVASSIEQSRNTLSKSSVSFYVGTGSSIFLLGPASNTLQEAQNCCKSCRDGTFINCNLDYRESFT
jgi:hypothetical protein